MEPRALLVDDELNIFNGFRRQLRGRLSIDMANSGHAALEILEKDTGYAVILADMYMPGMNGIEFLQKARFKAPGSVRVLLTGGQTQDLAMRAINDGQVFRFLTKPISFDDLSNALDACIAQHKLLIAERSVLQDTLGGSVRMLAEVLSVRDPASFLQGMHLRSLARDFAPHLRIRNSGDLELAAMLGNIGAILIPDTVMKQHRGSHSLAKEEQRLIATLPEKGRDLLSHVPRLEQVASIIYYQNKNFDGSGFPADRMAGEKIPLEARILRILKDLYQWEATGTPRMEAFKRLKMAVGLYDPGILDLLYKAEQELVVVRNSENRDADDSQQASPQQSFLGPPLARKPGCVVATQK